MDIHSKKQTNFLLTKPADNRNRLILSFTFFYDLNLSRFVIGFLDKQRHPVICPICQWISSFYLRYNTVVKTTWSHLSLLLHILSTTAGCAALVALLIKNASAAHWDNHEATKKGFVLLSHFNLWVVQGKHSSPLLEHTKAVLWCLDASYSLAFQWTWGLVIPDKRQTRITFFSPSPFLSSLLPIRIRDVTFDLLPVSCILTELLQHHN